MFAVHVLKMRLRLWWPGCEGALGASVTRQHITPLLQYEGPFLRESHAGARVERSTIYFETRRRHTLWTLTNTLPRSPSPYPSLSPDI